MVEKFEIKTLGYIENNIIMNKKYESKEIFNLKQINCLGSVNFDPKIYESTQIHKYRYIAVKFLFSISGSNEKSISFMLLSSLKLVRICLCDMFFECSCTPNSKSW